ncbi:MAG: LexA repressor [Acidimicrobiales bacterium]|nr:MAG: LexA repressor [Acidimicrobiales bacterium]
MTDRQREIFSFLRSYVTKHGYPPSVREIGAAVGLSSPSTVHAHLASIERAGLIRRNPARPRAIDVLAPKAQTPQAQSPADQLTEVPLLGHVGAGPNVLASEHVEEVLQLPTDLVGRGDLFALRVRGESMVGAGVLPGDLVIARAQPTAEPGDLVVAAIPDDEATVKRLGGRRGGRVQLIPENPDLEPFWLPTRDVRILGRVVAVFRRV